MKAYLNCQKISLNPQLPQPVYLQLADALLDCIRLHCEQECFFPSERALAKSLNIDRSTVAKAYEELIRRGMASRRSTYILQATLGAQQIRNPFPNIAVVIPHSFYDCTLDWTHPRYQYIIGITDRSAEKNISTMMLQLPPPEATKAQVAEVLDQLVVRVNGVIHLGARQWKADPVLHALLSDTRIPQVMISAYPANAYPHVGTVVASPVPGGMALAEKLKGLGHRTIGIIQRISPDDEKNPFVEYENVRRGERMISLFREYGLTCPEETLIYGCKNYEIVMEQLVKLLKKDALPDAFWCANDELAIWTLTVFKEIGIRVPEECSVIGYDGICPLPWSRRLTTLSLPFYAIGREAVDMIEDFRTKRNRQKRVIRELPTALEMRLTLDKCRKGRSFSAR